MKNVLICLIFLVVSSSSFEQKDSCYIWNKWCAQRDTLLLFTASYNVIEVYCTGMKPDEFYLKSIDKTLKISDEEVVGDTLTMLAMPYSTDKPMRLAIVNRRNNKTIKTVAFQGADVPLPRARLGHVKEYEVPKVNILAQVGLKVYFPNSLYDYPYRVKEFVLKTRIDKADVAINVKGSLINQEAEQAISKTPEGAVLEFTDIKATCPDCVTRTLDNFAIKIK